jgi:WD40 repeat protein
LNRLPTLVAAGASQIDAGFTYIHGVHWSKDGKTILAAAATGLVHRWNAQSGKPLPDEGYNHHLRFALTPNGSHVIIGDGVGRIDVWDLAAGHLVRQLAKEPEWRHALVGLAVSPDGRQVAAGQGHCDIWIFRIDGGEEVKHLLCPLRLDGGWMNFLAWAPDGKSVFTCASGMLLCRISLADRKVLWVDSDEDQESYALSPHGRCIVKTLPDGIAFFDTSTGKESARVPQALTPEAVDQHRPLRAITFAPDGKRLALAVGPNTVAVCDHVGRELGRFEVTGRKQGMAGHGLVLGNPGDFYYRVEGLAFTPDGKWIVSHAEDLSVRVWEVATGRQVRRFDGHNTGVAQVAVAPDGRSAFSSGADGFVYQWDLTPAPYVGSKRQLDDLWAAAAEIDPALAVPAAWAIVTSSAASQAFVAQRLPPFAAARREQIAKWLVDLDSANFAEREVATKALAAQGRTVERYLRDALRATASLEVRRRIRDLITRMESLYTPDELRALRLVQACELSGSEAARALLQRWARGAPGGMLTEDAKAAFARLDRCRR